MPIETITASEAVKLLKENPGHVIDVRTPVEHREIHVPGAKHVPLADFDPKRHAGDQPIVYLMCKSGARARSAAEKCIAAGVTNVRVIEGGITACAEAGAPVRRGKKGMTIERQVRAIVGGGVLTFTILGFALHPAFHAGAAFFGAGLLFAGLTDWCGLAILLAKMPWNRGTGGGASCSA
jgi:rhodanese-related sulfurtransferase